MNSVTATFANLDYVNLDLYMDDAKFLNLKLVSWKVVDDRYLDITLQGNYEMIKSYTNFINYEPNWTPAAIEAARLQRLASQGSMC